MSKLLANYRNADCDGNLNSNPDTAADFNADTSADLDPCADLDSECDVDARADPHTVRHSH